MKYFKVLSIIMLAVLLLFSGCNNSEQSVSITPEIEDAVAKAILKENESPHREGECSAEGHIIFGAKIKNDIIYVYTYTDFQTFGFQNGNFVDISGSSMPVVYKLDANNYDCIKVEYPKDGEGYTSSITKLFPKKYAFKALNLSDSDYENLNNQLDKYAENYLKSINREAKIGRMSDFEYILPSYVGISVEVENALSEIEKYHSYYPYWIGNQEFIENGIRYVYALDYDKENNKLIYSKYEYGKPEVILEKNYC